MKVWLKSMGFQSKSREKSIKNEQNQPLPVWGGPLECRYTVVHHQIWKFITRKIGARSYALLAMRESEQLHL